MQTTAELPGKAVGTVTQGKRDRPAVDPVELQQQLMRFADEFTAQVVASAEQLRRGTNALDRVELQKWKLTYASDAQAIASGQNAVANLLDMLVLVTMTRIALEEHWLPKIYGETARPMLEGCREAEKKVWLLAEPLASPEQREELRQAIREAYQQKPDPQSVSYIRALSLAAHFKKDLAPGRAEQRAQSVFSLLQIDPLAGMDPAVREIAQSRLFAERALYVAQRTPLLLRWQTELLSYQLAATPEAGNVLTNLNRFGQTADALTRTADVLPRLVNDQREAALKQLLDGVAAERTNFIASLAADEMKLRPTLVELRQTLAAGTELVKSSEATIHSLNTLMARFDPGTNAPTSTTTTNARPFDILDYAATAKEVTATIKELNAALSSLDRAAPQIDLAAKKLETASHRFLTRAFWYAAALLALTLGGAFVTATAYRRFSAAQTSIARPRSVETISR